MRSAIEIYRGATSLGIAVRAGVHSGDVEIRDAGLAVTIAKRICDLAGLGQVPISETIRELVIGSEIRLSLEGTHVLKGAHLRTAPPVVATWDVRDRRSRDQL